MVPTDFVSYCRIGWKMLSFTFGRLHQRFFVQKICIWCKGLFAFYRGGLWCRNQIFEQDEKTLASTGLNNGETDITRTICEIAAKILSTDWDDGLRRKANFDHRVALNDIPTYSNDDGKHTQWARIYTLHIEILFNAFIQGHLYPLLLPWDSFVLVVQAPTRFWNSKGPGQCFSSSWAANVDLQ